MDKSAATALDDRTVGKDPHGGPAAGHIQPSGDILSWRPRGKWQMYMRASPIMNVVDVADLWAALLYYSLTYLHQGIRDPVRMAL